MPYNVAVVRALMTSSSSAPSSSSDSSAAAAGGAAPAPSRAPQASTPPASVTNVLSLTDAAGRPAPLAVAALLVAKGDVAGAGAPKLLRAGQALYMQAQVQGSRLLCSGGPYRLAAKAAVTPLPAGSRPEPRAAASVPIVVTGCPGGGS